MEAVSHGRAREIMGEGSFSGFEEAKEHFGYNPALQEMNPLLNVPFSEGTLEKLRETYILELVPPFSVIDMCERVDSGLLLLKSHLRCEGFARMREKPNWQLVSKNSVPESTEKSWWKQLHLIDRSLTVPSVRIMACTLISHYLLTGERLFGDICVRVASVSMGQHVLVGYFDEKGIDILDGIYDSDNKSHVGICAMMKNPLCQKRRKPKDQKAQCL